MDAKKMDRDMANAVLRGAYVQIRETLGAVSVFIGEYGDPKALKYFDDLDEMLKDFRAASEAMLDGRLTFHFIEFNADDVESN